MSIAAVQAQKFYEQVAREGLLYTFTKNNEFLVFAVNDNDVVPFWSSRSRLETIKKMHPKYAAFSIGELPVKEFLEKTLPMMESEDIRIGVNWSGKRLVGYDVEPEGLRRNLDYWLKSNIDNGGQSL